jgi:hypothetical protein
MSDVDLSLTKRFSSKASPLVADLLRSDSKKLPPALQSVGNHEPKPRPILMRCSFRFGKWPTSQRCVQEAIADSRSTYT